MKESIGSSQLFVIVIVILLLFISIMSYTLKRANAFAMKDKIINAIEKEEGFNATATATIAELFEDSGYRQEGVCPENTTGYTRNMAQVLSNKKAAFCIKKISSSTGDQVTIGTVNTENGNVQKYYYEITVFYGLQLPIVGENMNFQMTSKTKGVKGVD